MAEEQSAAALFEDDLMKIVMERIDISCIATSQGDNSVRVSLTLFDRKAPGPGVSGLTKNASFVLRVNQPSLQAY